MSEKFNSKGGFILASVGAAVGLGNALRFPGLCAKYGGGAFLFVYFAALVILGLPLLCAETALGRKIKGGAPKAMASLYRGGGAAGWAACFNSAATAVIYAGLAGWILCEGIVLLKLCPDINMTRAEVGGYFFGEVLKARGDGVISGISPLVFFCIAAAWAAIFVCLKGGARSLSGAAKFTVIIPAALLCTLALRGLFYENSGEALKKLFLPDFAALSSPNLWISALGQVFFSLSLAVGIMPAYGAYLPEGTNIVLSSAIIAAADALVSLVASVAMFTTLYGCGMEGEIGTSGIITAFYVYPAAIKGLFSSPALSAAFGGIFYLSLAMMAVQSGASMLEAAIAPLSDRFHIKRGRLCFFVCAAGLIFGIVYATTAGVAVVETGDRFINFYNVIILCAVECPALAFGRQKDLLGEINRYTKRLKMPKRPFKISVGFLCPTILVLLIIPELKSSLLSPYPAYINFAFGWGISLTIALFALLFGRARRLSRR